MKKIQGNKYICSKCGIEIEQKLNFKSIKKMGIKKRINYPFGKNSNSRFNLFCNCGGVFL